MFVPDFESRILAQARAQGVAEPAETPGPPDLVDVWGARVASLVAAGSLDLATLNTMAWKAMGGETGSWVDPLFPGPAPLADLPGLGDRYRDLVFVGEGATARVFKALDTLLQRQVALKVLKAGAGTTLAEARAQAQVEHPNVCRVYEVGDGYLVLQLVEGPSLANLAPGLDLASKLRIVRDVALGAHAAHGRGLVHLDLKLDNILVQTLEDGSLAPMISDFGMVLDHRSLAGGCPMGTPPYTSPEQLAGEVGRLDRRTDVYALGMVAYVLLAGTIPFAVHDFASLLKAMAGEAPVPLRTRLPRLPADLAAIVNRCLAKAPEARYPTALALAEDLDRFLRGEAVAAMGPARGYRFRRWLWRNRRTAWVAGLGLAALLGTAGAAVRHSANLSEQADWDHHFQRTVEDLRAHLNHAYRQPPHDLTAELAKGRSYLGTIERAMAVQGATAQGPGHLALGQARLLLDPDDPLAVDDFNRAWAQGFRTEATRIWLVHAQVRAFNAAFGASYLAPNREAAAQARTQAAERYLRPAARMLKGRGSSDQARLEYLAVRAEAAAQERPDLARLTQLARTYQARFPGDIEAILETSQALENEAYDDFIRAHTGRAGPLRAESQALLREALRIAPSHPRVISALINSLDIEDLIQDPMTPPGWRLVPEIRTWIDAGRRLIPADPGFLYMHTRFLGGRELAARLSAGLPPEPTIRTLEDLLARGIATSDAGVVTSAAMGLEAAAETYRAYGRPCRALLEGAWNRLHAAESLPTGALRLTPRDRWVLETLAEMIFEEGGDPRGPLEDWDALAAAQPSRDGWVEQVRVAVLRARAALARGEDPDALLRAADRRVPVAFFQPWQVATLVNLRCCQAQASGRPEAWDALAQVLARFEPLMDRGDDGGSLPSLMDAEAALGRIRPNRARLETVKRALAAHAQDFWNPPALRNRWAAECLRLEAALAADPAPLLRAALRETDLGLARFRPDRAGTRQQRGGLYRPHRATFLGLRGELLVALADAEPGARATRLREARAALRQAVAANGNLARELAPLLARTDAKLSNRTPHSAASGRS